MRRVKNPIKIKKIIQSLLICIVLIIVVDCYFNFAGHGDISNVKERYEETNLYTREELSEAFIIVKKQFKDDFDGCRLTDIWYDETLNETESAELKAQYPSARTLVLMSTFTSGDKVAGNLKPNKTYEKWKWLLIKNNGDKTWTVLKSGE